jgi:hypothetical protein
MNKISISFVLIIYLMGCVSAINGQSGVVTQPEETVSQYSQFYTMPTGPVTGTHITAPQNYAIQSRTPTTVYFGNKMQAVPYFQYQGYATYTGGNSFWIQGSTSWTQYAVVPQNSLLSFIATSSTGGNGYLYEIYPDGSLSKNNNNFFPGYNQIGFNADTVGQHILLFAINGQVSNTIVIDVVSYQPPVYQQPIYQQPSYVPPIYYRPIYEPPEIPYYFPPYHRHNGNVSPHRNESPSGH